MASKMRVVKASWKNMETNETVEIQADVSDLFLADLIQLFEAVDGDEDYERGERVDVD